MMKMNRKRRESKQSAVVVLEGIRVCTEKTGIAPLWRAVRQLKNADDEILVLTILHAKEASGSISDAAGFGGDHHCNQSCEHDPYNKFLHQEIRLRKEIYLKIFRPYYDSCKINGVKFQVKIAAGYRPKDIIIEEANKAGATWIVMDRYFTRDLSFRLSGTDCNVLLVSDDDETMGYDRHIHSHDRYVLSMIKEETHRPKSPKLMKESILQQAPCCNPSLPVQQPSNPALWASTSRESEKQTLPEAQETDESVRNVKPFEEETAPLGDSPGKLLKANVTLGPPLQLSWEMITEITSRFSTKACTGKCKNYIAYLGYLNEHQSFVLVKRLRESSSIILDAEKKAASSMHHKNIMGLIGYHQSDTATVLVHPHPRDGTLENMLCRLGENTLKLKFQEKLKIAIGIAQGVRYMHQECPRGPIVHGELQLHNIFLRHDLRPLISGFGQAKWFQLEPESSISSKRWHLEDTLNNESMELLKSDVFSFGILLLRLFCRRSMPEDDKSLIEWARPLILKRKFHELLEEDSEVSDLHGIYRVLAAATQCTITKPTSRPYMSEVISILKGESFSAIESSPSGDSSL